jgi:hypothetical protein
MQHFERQGSTAVIRLNNEATDSPQRCWISGTPHSMWWRPISPLQRRSRSAKAGSTQTNKMLVFRPLDQVLAVAHDAQVMRENRGFIRRLKVDLRLPFLPLKGALTTTKWAPQVAQEAMTTDRRYRSSVADGETLQVADRGVPVAVISPVAGSNPLACDIQVG